MTFWQFLANPVLVIGEWLRGLLSGWELAPTTVETVMALLSALAVVSVPFIAIMGLIWASRKIIARLQDRYGPNASGVSAGPYAIFQTVADAIKILTKELIIPEHADRPVFILAPILVVLIALAVWAVIPFGPAAMQGVDLNIGLFYIVAIASLVLFSMMMAGWSSGNKYADVGAFRAISQIISYEVPEVLALITVVMLVGSLSLQDIVRFQQIPLIIALPIPAFIYLMALTAEVGRLPFEIAEADAEIVAGYFIEYSGMMFGAFYLAEFINIFAGSILFSVIFLGGWQGPFVDTVPILGAVWLLIKGLVIFTLFMFFWGAMPRMRIDHILNFSWKFLTPLGLVMIIVVALVDTAARSAGITAMAGRSLVLLMANLVVAAVTMGILRRVDARMQQRELMRQATLQAKL